MKISLLISTYNWLEALELVLLSLLNQTVMPDEILIADDGSREDTRDLILSFQKKLLIPLIHTWHEDDGFRKAIILNKAIAQSSGEYIIQVDGDCIMHRKFVEDHKLKAQQGMFIHGTRANIKEEFVEEIFSKQMIHFNYFSSKISNRSRTLYMPLLSYLNKRSDILPKNVRGCNLSFWKEDFVAINGYDEDFVGWGYEDLDIVARMMHNSVDALKVRDCAILFHIYHPELLRDRERSNSKLYEQVLNEKKVRCTNGIDKCMNF